MPPVAHFALSYAAGLWAGFQWAPPFWAWLLVALGALGWGTRDRWGAALLLAAVIAGVQGAAAARQRARSCAESWGPGRQAAMLQLFDRPDGRGLGRGRILHTAAGCGGDILIRLSPDAAPSGATLLAVGTFHRRGAFRVEHVRPLSRPRPWRFVLRDALAHRIGDLYGPRAPLVDALVLARRGDLDPGLRADFVAAGLAHLLAISGLHVGIIAGWLTALARALGARRRAWSLSAIVTWGYVGMLGFPAPATRAAAFVSLHAIARQRQRHPRFGAVLAVAVLVVLVVDPRAVTAVGAWLSAAAVWGTGLATSLPFLRRRAAAARLGAASLGATLATAPITAFAFGTVAPVGVLANFAAIPLASVAVPAIFASLVLTPVAAGAGLALGAIERTAQLAAAAPFGHLAGDAGLRFAVPWALLLLAGAWWRLRRPTWALVGWRAACLASLGAWVLVLATLRPPHATRDVALHVLAVGQGDAIAVRTPRGRWVLVDAGPRVGGRDAGRRVVVPFLRRQGARTLDLLVVTHGDADHLGGIPAALARFPATLLLDPGQPLGTPLYLEYLGALDRSRADWRPARAGDILTVDGVRFEVLHPSAEWLRREVRPNENSVVLKVSYGAFDALLTGDIGWPAESLLLRRVGQVELLKVGHHGSAGGTSAAWLRVVRPKVAVVSVGANAYGHPASEVLGRLEREGAAVYRTDRDGTVTVRSDGRYFAVSRGSRHALHARLPCLVRGWLPSRASSSSGSGCTPRPRASSPISYTTWPSPPR